MKPDQQRAYWRQNVRYVFLLLAGWALVSFGAGIVFADELDAIPLFGLPLGFWFGEQGALLAFTALIFIYVLLMNALDRVFGVYEG